MIELQLHVVSGNWKYLTFSPSIQSSILLVTFNSTKYNHNQKEYIQDYNKIKQLLGSIFHFDLTSNLIHSFPIFLSISQQITIVQYFYLPNICYDNLYSTSQLINYSISDQKSFIQSPWKKLSLSIKNEDFQLYSIQIDSNMIKTNWLSNIKFETQSISLSNQIDKKSDILIHRQIIDHR